MVCRACGLQRGLQMYMGTYRLLRQPANFGKKLTCNGYTKLNQQRNNCFENNFGHTQTP